MKLLVPNKVLPANYYLYPNIDPAHGYDNSYETALGYAEWSAVTAYTVGQYCFMDSLQSVFIAVANSTNVTPTLTGTTPWVRVSATNAWKPFDGVVSNQMSAYAGAGGTMDAYTIQIFLFGMGSYNAICLLECDCYFVQIQCNDGDGNAFYSGVVYAPDVSAIYDAYTYMFTDLSYNRNFAFEMNPGMWGDTTTAAVIQIRIYGYTGQFVPKVGEIVVGHAYDIGNSQADVKKRLVDYSKKTADAFGNVAPVSRAYSYQGTFDMRIPKSKVGLADNLVAKYRATPCTFYPDTTTGNQGAIIYGYISDYESTYTTPDYIHATLQVEGLT